MRNKRIIKILFLFIIITFFSCKKKTLSRDDYAEYVTNEDNGLIKKQEFNGGITVELLYQPLEYIYLKERKESAISLKDFENWKIEKTNYEFYILRLRSNKTNEISQHNASNFGEYTQTLDYLISDFQNDIVKVTGKDTLACLLYHYERNFGISANNNFSLIFSKDKQNTDKTIVIDLKMYDLGNVKFKFTKEDIDNLPKLVLEV